MIVLRIFSDAGAVGRCLEGDRSVIRPGDLLVFARKSRCVCDDIGAAIGVSSSVYMLKKLKIIEEFVHLKVFVGSSCYEWKQISCGNSVSYKGLDKIFLLIFLRK